MVVGSSLTLNYHFGRNGLAYRHNKLNKQSKKDIQTDVLFTWRRRRDSQGSALRSLRENRLCSASPREFESLCLKNWLLRCWFFKCFPLAVPKEIFALFACSISLTAAPIRAPCFRHRRRSHSLPAPEPALGTVFIMKQ